MLKKGKTSDLKLKKQFLAFYLLTSLACFATALCSTRSKPASFFFEKPTNRQIEAKIKLIVHDPSKILEVQCSYLIKNELQVSTTCFKNLR